MIYKTQSKDYDSSDRKVRDIRHKTCLLYFFLQKSSIVIKFNGDFLFRLDVNVKLIAFNAACRAKIDVN